ncbi:MAG: hypothetical protein HeimC2_35210 [Candidatus Heimdallarchaeota archaeon LC_2]|nr:MAG: hypothetical protein HeimC2_35210 [Candidatus Heimdallarchaeota archaeon LC_2]
MTSKEMLAIRYTFFRFPSHYALTVIPVISGIISVFFLQQFDEVTFGNQWKFVSQNQYNLVESYLLISKIALIFIASFFIAFKWSNMEINGSYGFWLTQRVKRHSFYFQAVGLFIIEIYLSLTLGILLLLYLIGIKITTIELMQLMILLLIQIMIIVAGAILLAEIIPNAEITASSLLSFGTLNFFLNTDDSSILHKILKSDLHFQESSIIFPLILSTLTAIALLGISFVIHLRRSIDL